MKTQIPENIVIQQMPPKKATAKETLVKTAQSINFTNTCSVCNEKYNKTTHKKIVCYCTLELCATCIKTYILSKQELPHCFNCNIEWNREFLIKNINASWVNTTYAVHHKSYLFKLEESQFTDTIVYIEDKNRKKQEIAILNIEIEQYQKIIKPLIKQVKQYQSKIDEAHRKIHNISVGKKSLERKEFICKCPNGDCIGYLSSAHKCDLCNNWFCPECKELKGEERDAVHTCNPDTVETVKLLQKECKKCPNCTSVIYKIDGCDMMWCISCHTAFSWRTLQILNGENIHNPHYFEWLRTQQTNGNPERNPNDILCGREIDNAFITSLLNKMRRAFNLMRVVSPVGNAREIAEYDQLSDEAKKYNNIVLLFSAILRSALHIRFDDINRRFNNQRINNEETVRETRMAFMEKVITEDEFKSALEKRNRVFEKNNQFATLLRMYINCLTDILYRLYDNITKDNIEAYINEINGLKDYVDVQLKNISKIYGCVCYIIDSRNDWFLRSKK